MGELQKNAACYLKQIIEATHSQKQQLYGDLPPISQTIQDKQDARDIAGE